MLPLAFGFGGPWDVAIVAGVAILLFGGKQLPGFFKSLGDGITEFKKATAHDEAAEVAATPVQNPLQPPVAVGSVPIEEKK